MKRRTRSIIVVVACLSLLLVVLCDRFVLRPLRVGGAEVWIEDLTQDSLRYYAAFLRDHTEENVFSYRRADFTLDAGDPGEYCLVGVLLKLKNAGVVTLTPKALIPRKENDVVGFSIAPLKSDAVHPGEAKELLSVFICKRNGMRDDRLREFLFGLPFALVQNDNHFGVKHIKVSLKPYAP